MCEEGDGSDGPDGDVGWRESQLKQECSQGFQSGPLQSDLLSWQDTDTDAQTLLPFSHSTLLLFYIYIIMCVSVCISHVYGYCSVK